METLQLILLLFAYTLGIVTLFVQLICYARKIEFKETIFLSISFLLLIMAVTFDVFFIDYNQETATTNVPTLIAMVLLGLTTLLNVFKERQISIKPVYKTGLIVFSSILVLTIIVGYYLDVLAIIEYVVTPFLLISVIYAMRIVRTTKPTVRIKHRERIERITALVCIFVLPLALAIDYLPDYIPFLNFDTENPLRLTLPLLFIFIASGKLVDDIKRLSLFKPENKIVEQNLKNYNFTKRETEIVDLLIKGATYSQISETLFISLPTVKTHVSNIYRKAEVNNKIGLINLITN